MMHPNSGQKYEYLLHIPGFSKGFFVIHTLCGGRLLTWWDFIWGPWTQILKTIPLIFQRLILISFLLLILVILTKLKASYAPFKKSKFQHQMLQSGKRTVESSNLKFPSVSTSRQWRGASSHGSHRSKCDM